MKIVIIEDEYPAADRLQKMLQKIQPTVEVPAVLGSVEEAMRWFRQNPAPDLILSDIQLSDGLSFAIFDQIILKSPIIFTTSYDEYAIKAFKVKSIDYLLKPIKPDELAAALRKLEGLRADFSVTEHSLKLESLLDALPLTTKKYKRRFLVKQGEELVPVTDDEIAYFYTKHEVVNLVRKDGRKFIVDYILDQLEQLLNPGKFFRINRQYIIHLSTIHKIHTYFNSKLKLDLLPAVPDEVLVSRSRAAEFKEWLEG